MIERAPILLAAILTAGFAENSALAAEAPLRELCVDRPGKDTPPCIIEKGHAVVEVGAFAYSRGPDSVDQYGIDALLVRSGLTERAELQLAFSPYAIVRTTDVVMGGRQSYAGAGDLTVAMRRNFLNPDGSGVSIAGQVFVSVPTGKHDLGAGAWEGGIIVPISFDLSDDFSLTVDPEIDVRGNESGSGHRVAYTGVVSISRDLGSGITGSAEIWSMVDRDPVQSTTEASFDLMLAWTPLKRNNLQFDIEVDLGLTPETPAVEIQAGVALRF